MSNLNNRINNRRAHNFTNYANFYTNAVNFSIQLHNTIQNYPLPIHCTLRPRVQNADNDADNYHIHIDFSDPNSIFNGTISISIPYETYEFTIEEGYVHMMCMLNAHNGIFLEITVNSLDEMYDVIAFCQNILQYQPNNEANDLEYVRVPHDLLDYWCVSDLLRELNLNPPPRWHGA